MFCLNLFSKLGYTERDSFSSPLENIHVFSRYDNNDALYCCRTPSKPFLLCI